MSPTTARSPRRVAHGFCLFALLTVGACSTAPVPPVLDRTAVRDEVLDVIRENPKLILDTLTEYQATQAAARERAERAALEARIASLDLVSAAKDSPARGSAAYKLVLFEFSDFQCPFCARASAGVREFVDAHADEVTLVYKHLPLGDMHPEAINAARAAWAAQQQGRFWEYHDALFAHQGELSEALYLSLATQLKIDRTRFERDRASPAANAAIQRDVLLAQSLGVNGTPFFLLGREPLAGALPATAFEQALARLKAQPPVNDSPR